MLESRYSKILSILSIEKEITGEHNSQFDYIINFLGKEASSNVENVIKIASSIVYLMMSMKINFETGNDKNSKELINVVTIPSQGL